MSTNITDGFRLPGTVRAEAEELAKGVGNTYGKAWKKDRMERFLTGARDGVGRHGKEFLSHLMRWDEHVLSVAAGKGHTPLVRALLGMGLDLRAACRDGADKGPCQDGELLEWFWARVSIWQYGMVETLWEGVDRTGASAALRQKTIEELGRLVDKVWQDREGMTGAERFHVWRALSLGRTMARAGGLPDEMAGFMKACERKAKEGVNKGGAWQPSVEEEARVEAMYRLAQADDAAMFEALGDAAGIWEALTGRAMRWSSGSDTLERLASRLGTDGAARCLGVLMGKGADPWEAALERSHGSPFTWWARIRLPPGGGAGDGLDDLMEATRRGAEGKFGEGWEDRYTEALAKGMEAEGPRAEAVRAACEREMMLMSGMREGGMGKRPGKRI